MHLSHPAAKIITTWHPLEEKNLGESKRYNLGSPQDDGDGRYWESVYIFVFK